jgi:NAD(P)-dependent dehydrogenase (short-subunit alcohol dehydrogenase family)
VVTHDTPVDATRRHEYGSRRVRADGGRERTPDGSDERVALVTGGTDGIGKETARGLAADGASVAIVGRTAEKGRDAAAAIAEDTGNPAVEFLQTDLSLMANVRDLAATVRGRYDRLDALVHSAGVLPGEERVVTGEGLESSFAINYLSRFLLTTLLADRLVADGGSRVVDVAFAGGNDVEEIHFDDLQREHDFDPESVLGQAQVANDVFAVELDDRWGHAGVSATVVNPGAVDTDIRRRSSTFWQELDEQLRADALSVEEGARTPIHLATEADPDGVAGRFFGPGVEEIEVPEAVRDPDLRARLWRVSEALTGLAAD